VPGSQAGVALNIGGGLIKVLPNGTVVSPPVNGFRGMGLDGVGWGTGSGITVIYGVAAPVKTPLLGQVRKP
jgi:hypothetical protein